MVERLREDYRCVALTLPLGGHRQPMKRDADLSLAGIALLIGEAIEALALQEVTLVQTDWGGAQILLALQPPRQLSRAVMCSCEAFDNYPPPPAKIIPVLARVPGGLWLLMAALRLDVVRRSPSLWGALNRRPLPRELLDRWFAPATTSRAIRQDLAAYATSSAIRQDLAAYATSIPPKTTLLDWAERSRSFGGPVLVAWADEDRIMHLEHGRRLAALCPDSRYVQVENSRTLICRDQPQRLAQILRQFLATTSPHRA